MMYCDVTVIHVSLVHHVVIKGVAIKGTICSINFNGGKYVDNLTLEISLE